MKIRKLVTSLIIVVSLSSTCSLYCPGEVTSRIGGFTSLEEGDRASIQKLSKEVRRCPNARKYKVVRKVVAGGDEVAWRAAMYEREGEMVGRIGHEADPNSGFRGDVYIVNDDAIHAVARESGNLDYFAKYGTTLR